MNKITLLSILLVVLVFLVFTLLFSCRRKTTCGHLIKQRQALIQGSTRHSTMVEQQLITQTDSLILQVCDTINNKMYEN